MVRPHPPPPPPLQLSRCHDYYSYSISGVGPEPIVRRGLRVNKGGALFFCKVCGGDQPAPSSPDSSPTFTTVYQKYNKFFFKFYLYRCKLDSTKKAAVMKFIP